MNTINFKAALRGISVALLIGVLAGCELLGDDEPAATSERLLSEWEWLQSTGGLAGWTLTPDCTGLAPVRLVFDRNRAASYEADTLEWRVGYTLKQEDDVWRLRYERDAPHVPVDQQVRFQGRDTLVLIDECIDCYVSTYLRIK